MSESLPPHESAPPPHWFLRRPLLALLAAIIVADCRVLSAAFVSFDDDIHVYANPYLNPPTLESIARFWQQPYEALYVPLAYSIFGALAAVARVPSHIASSVGHIVSLDPALFHGASVVVHVANAWLVFVFARQLTRRADSALLCALVFALHPLQLESVGWISELRGLASSCFALLALNAFVLARRTQARVKAKRLLLGAVLCVTCAMLCKPTAIVLPLVALALDRTVFETSWRRALTVALSWALVTVPFAVVTRSLQVGASAGQSAWWQRPFVAGDALAFYLFKVVLPFDLCVDYGRTPSRVLSHAAGYCTWLLPLALVAFAYVNRRRWPQCFLGALLFVTFLLPTLGLVPFSFQAYSTVADRYTYLALIGVGLGVAEAVAHFPRRKLPARLAVVALAALGMLSFEQSRFWMTSSALLRHTLDVDPNAAFAYNSLGDVELGNGDTAAALADYQACVRIDPTRVKAYLNLAELYAASEEPAEAERAVAAAERAGSLSAGDDSNLGIVLMKMNQPARALSALEAAVTLEPTSPVYLANEANALSSVGHFDDAEAAFRRCIVLAPTLAGAHTGLGIVLAETGRLPAALGEFRAAVRLQPGDPAALDDLKKAEALTQARER